MKAKLAIMTVIGLVACNLAMAQSDSPGAQPAAPETPPAQPAAPEAQPAPPATPEAQPAQPAPEAQPAQPPATPEAQPTPAPAPEAQPTPAPAPADPQATTPETKPASPDLKVFAAETPAPATNGAPAPGAIIPLIHFQSIPLTTAIENLARQANLNYILDPKTGLGLPDEKGQIKDPPISVRWENLTANQALYGLLNTYGLQIVDDSKTKIARITLKDPAALEPLMTKVIQLKFAAPSNVLAAVQGTLSDKRSKVVADVRTSQLVVVATEKEHEAVENLITSLDTQTKQVLIEAKILETTLNPKTQKGVNWSGTLAHQNFAFGNNSLPGIAPTPAITYTDPVTGAPNTIPGTPGSIGGILNHPGVLWNSSGGFVPANAFLNADGVMAYLSFLNESGDTKVVSEPRMVTLDNQKAAIDVGLLYPIVNTTAGTANTTGGSAISYSNLTVNLDVTPRITANNFIELKVQQGVMRLGPNFVSTVGGVANNVNSFFTRKLDTSVLIPSGNTLVMGGLIQDEKLNGNTKVPILGDIPGLGLLFRHDRKERNKQNLTIFITPTVVEDTDFQPKQTDYLKTTGNEAVLEDWSAWDSGKPASEIKKNQSATYSEGTK